MIQGMLQGDFAAMQASRDQRGKGLGKIVWINLIEIKLAILKSPKEFRIRAAARAERFDCEGREIILTEMTKEKGGYQSLARAGISAGDEDDLSPLRFLKD